MSDVFIQVQKEVYEYLLNTAKARDEILNLYTDIVKKQFVGELKSGEDWLSRFREELENENLHVNDAGSVFWDSGDVMRAAKRAAGLQ